MSQQQTNTTINRRSTKNNRLLTKCTFWVSFYRGIWAVQEMIMKKSFMLTKAVGSRPMTEEEIRIVGGGDQLMADDPMGKFGETNTVGVTWRDGVRSSDSGVGY